MKKLICSFLVMVLLLSISTMGASAAYLDGGTGYTSTGNVTWTFTLSSTAPASPNFQYGASSTVTFGGSYMDTIRTSVATSNNTDGKTNSCFGTGRCTSAYYSGTKPSWARGSFDAKSAFYGTAAFATGQVTYRT